MELSYKKQSEQFKRKSNVMFTKSSEKNLQWLWSRSNQILINQKIVLKLLSSVIGTHILFKRLKQIKKLVIQTSF